MKSALLMLLRIYKSLLSPLLPPACRFVPTCSEYAAEAVELHGPIKGALLAAWRLARCHPFSRGGFDPVPIPCGPGLRPGCADHTSTPHQRVWRPKEN